MLVPSQELGDPARVRFLVDEHKRTAANRLTIPRIGCRKGYSCAIYGFVESRRMARNEVVRVIHFQPFTVEYTYIHSSEVTHVESKDYRGE